MAFRAGWLFSIVLTPLGVHAAELAVPGGYATIQQAIDAAQSGDTAVIGPGEYEEPLTLKSGVSLKGAGTALVFVRFDTANSPVLKAKGCVDAAVEDITFESAPLPENAEAPENAFAVLHFLDSSLTIRDCAIRKGKAFGLMLEGKNATAVEKCESSDNRRSGIYVTGKDAAPTLSGAICARNGGSGITFEGGAKGVANGNTCEHNNWHGVYVTGAGTSPEVRENTCGKNGACGIRIESGAQVTATANTCNENNASGICLDNVGTFARLIHNTALDNVWYGLHMGDGPDYETKENIIHRNNIFNRHELSQMFHENRFDLLEEMAERLRTGKRRYVEGTWQIVEFYRLLSYHLDYTDKEHEEYFLKQMDKWDKAFPESGTQRAALARAYYTLAWRDRGGGYASEVTPEGWKEFHSYMKRCLEAITEAERRNPNDPGIFPTKFDICFEDDLCDPEEVFEKGVTLEPELINLYSAKVRYLLPKWGGSMRKVHEFALECVERTRPIMGEAMYVYVMEWAREEREFDDFFREYPADWPQLRQAFPDAISYLPDNSYWPNLYALMACHFNDKATAKPLFEDQSIPINYNVWHTRENFERWKAWLYEDAPHPMRVPIVQAVRAGNIKQVKALLAGGAGVDTVDEEGNSLLMIAIGLEKDHLITPLIEAGADLHFRDPNGYTPLVETLSRDTPGALLALLKADADPNKHLPEDPIPLVCAIRWEKPAFARYLIDTGANPNVDDGGNFRPLQYALELGYTPVALALLEKGADPNQMGGGDSPLMIAVEKKNITAFYALLERGAEVDFHGATGWTALMSAADVGCLECAQELLKRGADPLARKTDGWTAYHMAVMSGQRGVLELLVQHNREGLDVRTNAGRTLLQQAAKSGRKDIAAYLIENGADVNAHNDEDKTPLALARAGGYTDIVTLLLEHGAKE